MKKYNPKEIEKKWQKYWQDQKVFAVTEDPTKKKFYALIEFPYPSAEGLHVGHPRPFTAMDVVSRKRRMEGYNVLYPIGFDAFGLPTENFAIKTGRPPAEVTKKNIANFTRQLKALGYGFAWDRQVNTSDPAYYKWTQWIFLQFFKHGLAYKKNIPINWCPRCKIGLANEEVVNGACERCEFSPVEKRNKEQWMLAITKYADNFLEGLKEVDYIPQARVQQENWIGRSEGALVKFDVRTSATPPNPPLERGESAVSPSAREGVGPAGPGGVGVIEVFTTRPDTLFGATYMVLAPEHELVKNQKLKIKNFDEVERYIAQVKNKTEQERTAEGREKTGVELKGIKAINPANNEAIPVWIADYVLASYGTGAIMAVPAHDERDWEFAEVKKLPIKEVISSEMWMVEESIPSELFEREKLFNDRELSYALNANGVTMSSNDGGKTWMVIAGNKEFLRKALKKYYHGSESLHARLYSQELPFTDRGVMINSEEFSGLDSELGKKEMIKWLEEKGSGKRQVNYKLRDWVFSRQRYWGEPIPLVWCEACASQIKNQKSKIKNSERNEGELLNPGWIQLLDSELPLELPPVEKYQPTDTGESPLAQMLEWVKTICPRCGGPARRETDTMPNWAGSSWYFLRYCDPHNNKEFAGMEKLKYWMGNNTVIPNPRRRGEESLSQSPMDRDASLDAHSALSSWPKGRNDKGGGGVDWYNGGMEHTVLHLLYSRFWNQFLFNLGLVPTREPYKKRTSHGLILGPDGEKMSKSRGNVINPDEMIAKFGADALRAYIMFMGPFDQPVMWDTNGLVGVRRWLDRVWGLQEKVTSETSPQSPPLRPSTVVQGALSLSNERRRGGGSLSSAEERAGGEVSSRHFTSLLHRTIKKVSDDIEQMRFNTAIAKLMELVNEMMREEAILPNAYRILIQLLSPFVPHIAEELWEKYGPPSRVGEAGDGRPLAYSAWPQYDPELAKEETLTIVVQVNGKVRDQIEVAADTSEEEIKARALASEKIQKWLEGKELKKVIYVAGRLVSIVI